MAANARSQLTAIPVLRASRKGVQAEVCLDYLGHGQVTLNLSLTRGDAEVREAMAPLEALLLRRAKTAVADIQTNTHGRRTDSA